MATAKVSPLSSHAQFPNNPDTKLVALYARVSTKDKGQETENQLRQLRDFAIHSGWTIVAEYIDHESARFPIVTSFSRCLRTPAGGSLTFSCSGRLTGSRGKAFCQRSSICK